MNGIEKLELQIEAGTRPIIKDIDEISIYLGFDKVVTLTPKVETKLRSGEWAQISMQIDCILDDEFRLNITFIKGYPKVKPIVYVLCIHSKARQYNRAKNEFDPPTEFNIDLTNAVKEYISAYIDHENLLINLVKYFVNNLSCSKKVVCEPQEVKETESESVEIIDTKQCILPPNQLYRCKICRCDLFHSSIVQPSSSHISEENKNTENIFFKCQNIFLNDPPDWLPLDNNEGKILCPNEKCRTKLGSWSWSGMACNCTAWVTPCFQITSSKVDVKVIA